MSELHLKYELPLHRSHEQPPDEAKAPNTRNHTRSAEQHKQVNETRSGVKPPTCTTIAATRCCPLRAALARNRNLQLYCHEHWKTDVFVLPWASGRITDTVSGATLFSQNSLTSHQTQRLRAAVFVRVYRECLKLNERPTQPWWCITAPWEPNTLRTLLRGSSCTATNANVSTRSDCVSYRARILFGAIEMEFEGVVCTWPDFDLLAAHSALKSQSKLQDSTKSNFHTYVIR